MTSGIVVDLGDEGGAPARDKLKMCEKLSLSWQLDAECRHDLTVQPRCAEGTGTVFRKDQCLLGDLKTVKSRGINTLIKK